jgi:hypothetical protein
VSTSRLSWAATYIWVCKVEKHRSSRLQSCRFVCRDHCPSMICFYTDIRYPTTTRHPLYHSCAVLHALSVAYTFSLPFRLLLVLDPCLSVSTGLFGTFVAFYPPPIASPFYRHPLRAPFLQMPSYPSNTGTTKLIYCILIVTVGINRCVLAPFPLFSRGLRFSCPACYSV